MANKKPREIDLFRVITTSFCVLLAVIALVFVITIATDIKGSAGSRASVEVTVPKGSSASQIADILKDQGIISSSLAYKTYTAFYKELPNYQYGKFMLNSHMSYDQIAQILQNPSDFATTLTFTFPEGTTALKMAIMMVEGGMEFTVEDFMAACNDDYSGDVSFYSLIEASNNKFCKLEGYLFPSQYEFYFYDTPHTVIAKMLKGFEDNVYTGEFKQKVEASGMSLEQTMILASFVEKESPGDDDIRAKISSVFHNRLAKNSPLPMMQSDTSTSWAGYPVGVIQYYYDNYAKTAVPAGMLEAYDTYAVSGLTPGAICNPGVACINAALNPASTDYYYFVYDKTGTTYFAKTYQEHLANVDKVKRTDG